MKGCEALFEVHKYAPDFPVLTEEQRRASPAQRVPMVLEHPLNHELALYGMNGGTCRVLSKEATFNHVICSSMIQYIHI